MSGKEEGRTGKAGCKQRVSVGRKRGGVGDWKGRMQELEGIAQEWGCKGGAS